MNIIAQTSRALAGSLLALLLAAGCDPEPDPETDVRAAVVQPDRASLEGTLDWFETIDFESGDDGQPISTTGDTFLGWAGLTVQGVFFQPTENYLVVRDYGDGSNGFLYGGRAFPGGVTYPLRVNFPTGGSLAFGANIGSFYAAADFVITLSTGETFTHSTSSGSFFGVTTDTPFDWVEIEITSAPSAAYGQEVTVLDNVTFRPVVRKFENQANFETEFPNLQFVDFEAGDDGLPLSTNGDTTYQSGLDVNDASFVGNGGYLVVRDYGDGPNGFLYGGRSYSDTSFEKLTAYLPAGVHEVGFRLRPMDEYHNAGVIRVTLSTGQTYQTSDFQSFDVWKFCGLASDDEIEWVAFELISGPRAGYSFGTLKIDDFMFTHPPTAPIANIGGPYSGEEGSPIAFDATASESPDGSEITYSWDFGDGQTGSGPTPSHTYAQEGTYTVTLTADSAGGQHVVHTTVEVANVAPSVDAGPDGVLTWDPSKTVCVKQKILCKRWRFSTKLTVNGSFTDPGADTWQCKINWGDGKSTGYFPCAPGQTITRSHTYYGYRRFRFRGPKKRYNVKLVVNDGTDVGHDTLVLRVPH